ncbi:hypothetical protein P3T22_002673 [Paraburkholderia sp. GAS348]
MLNRILQLIRFMREKGATREEDANRRFHILVNEIAKGASIGFLDDWARSELVMSEAASVFDSDLRCLDADKDPQHLVYDGSRLAKCRRCLVTSLQTQSASQSGNPIRQVHRVDRISH